LRGHENEHVDWIKALSQQPPTVTVGDPTAPTRHSKPTDTPEKP
jgi:hypothetical protein